MAKRRRSPAARATGCPCGGPSLATCCGPVIESAAAATTPEALMRSRYTAHAINDTDHLAATWDPSGRPSSITHDAAVRWLGLEILDAPAVQPSDTEGWVEFVARFQRAGERAQLHERSRFTHHDGQWWYIDGELKS